MRAEVIQFLSIIPFGLIQEEVLNFLQFELANLIGFQARIFNAQPIPQYAFDSKRNQYHSTRILENLKQIKSRGELILGIMDADLYVPELSFVFGEANILDSVCIISIMRLRQEYYGLPENNTLFLERILKEAIHEIGHTYGLAHCDNPKCIMHFSNSLRDTDTKGPGFCFGCEMKVK